MIVLNKNDKVNLFKGLKATIIHNIESGKLNNPTPIQMQTVPTLLNRRDLLWSLAAIDIVVQEVLVEVLGSSAELSSRDLFLPRLEFVVDGDAA